jgi:hypothetical protein
MNELLNWLLQQKGSLRTCIEFQERALALRVAEPGHAALLRLLADLAGRFAEICDGRPLSAEVAAHALDQLTTFLERAVGEDAESPSGRLALLNEIGTSELAWSDSAPAGRQCA